MEVLDKSIQHGWENKAHSSLSGKEHGITHGAFKEEGK